MPNRTDSDEAPITLAILADVQYADKPSQLVHNSYGPYTRHYRESLPALTEAIRRVNERHTADDDDDNLDDPRNAPVVGLLHLGDCIDGSPTLSRSLSDLNAVLRAFALSRVPVHHVVGNHCLSVPRSVLRDLIPAFDPSFYYARRLLGHRRWTLIVLDTTDVSPVNGTDGAMTKLGRDWIEAHPDSPNRRWWNGGVGDVQLSWLQGVLDSIRDRGVPGEEACRDGGGDGNGGGGGGNGRGRGSYAVVATHIPLLPGAADPTHVAFNGSEVSAVLDSYGPQVVRVVLSGHFHRGGETVSVGGVRHRTVRGVVEGGGLEYIRLADDGSFEVIEDSSPQIT